MSDRTKRLVSIRHRTDHDLTVLVSRELDRGFALVDVATTRTSPLFAQAERAQDIARAILPRISALSDGDRLRVLVKGRFVVEVETHNQPPNAAIAWARQFDIPKITGTSDSIVAKLPNPVTVVSIDELNPKANSSYQVNWSTQEDLDAARRRKP
jgi:hypothetical protein